MPTLSTARCCKKGGHDSQRTLSFSCTITKLRGAILFLLRLLAVGRKGGGSRQQVYMLHSNEIITGHECFTCWFDYFLGNSRLMRLGGEFATIASFLWCFFYLEYLALGEV